MVKHLEQRLGRGGSAAPTSLFQNTINLHEQCSSYPTPSNVARTWQQTGSYYPSAGAHSAVTADSVLQEKGNTDVRSWSNLGNPAPQTPSQFPIESRFLFGDYSDPRTAKDSNMKTTQPPLSQDQDQDQDQYQAGQLGNGSYPPSDEQSVNSGDSNAQPAYQQENQAKNPLPDNFGDQGAGDVVHTNPQDSAQEEGEQTQSIRPLTNEQKQEQLEQSLKNKDIEALDIVLQLIETVTTGIKDQLAQDSAKEANISQNANKLYNASENLYDRSNKLFSLYSVAAELEKSVDKKTEWTQKAKEQFEEIQANPLYSKEINNEQERRDACERMLRFIGETTSKIIGLGFGFGAAVAVASLMIPPAVLLYGPIIVAGPVIAAGAGGAAAFMANKLGYKIADLTISNTAAFVGKILDGGKNKAQDSWKSWKGDKQQEKALTKLKNNLLQEIEKAQSGFINAKNNNDQTQMDEHLANLYIKASVLKDLETSIVGKRAAEKKAQEALENWKKNASFIEKMAKKIGAEEAWKFITETNPKNICEKLGIITGQILGLVAAAGVGAAAAVAITTSIGAAATILYGPMAVVGITAGAGIAAGAVSYKIANPVATWSAKKVGQVADLAKNAIYEIAKYMAGKVIGIGKEKDNHSDKVRAQKQDESALRKQ